VGAGANPLCIMTAAERAIMLRQVYAYEQV
jgi:hypothetical protein